VGLRGPRSVIGWGQTDPCHPRKVKTQLLNQLRLQVMDPQIGLRTLGARFPGYARGQRPQPLKELTFRSEK